LPEEPEPGKLVILTCEAVVWNEMEDLMVTWSKNGEEVGQFIPDITVIDIRCICFSLLRVKIQK